MWQTLRHSREMDPVLVDTAIELLRSTSRALVALIGGVYLLAILGTVIWPEEIGSQVWLVAPIILVSCWMAIRLVSRNILLANSALLLGLALAIDLLAYLFQSAEISFILVFLPFIAMVTVGWPLALGAFGVIAASLAALHGGLMHTPITSGQVLGVALASVFVTLLSHTSSRAIMTVSQWSVASYQQALANLQELRERRAELAHLVHELDRTSRSLERTNHVLVLARASAEEARDTRNRLALTVSHELRTPLNFVIGFSELMVSSPETYAPLEEWPQGLYDDIQEIYNSSSHLLGLVNDVIDLGQMESLQTVLFKDWADPQQILFEVETMVRPAFERKGLWLRVESDPELPNVYVDRVRIRQVLLNLITNSLRFTGQGGVTVRAVTDGELLKVFVQDTGTGIAAADLPHIFEPFRGSDPKSWRQHEGAGLGLSISHRLIELHGGEIWVQETTKQGTTFCFTLPTAEAARTQARVSQNADERYWHWREQRAERDAMVLACSPQPDVSQVLAPFVGDLQVMATQDLEQVPRLIQEMLPRAVLLDQDYVSEHELKTLRESQPYDLPLVALPFPGRPNRRPIERESVIAQFIKPVERHQLIRAVNSLGLKMCDVLVVDDDVAMARFVRRVLTSPEARRDGHTYEIVATHTGSQALAKVSDWRPDIVLLDITLPDMTGWDVLDELEPLGIPVILMTGHENEFATQDQDTYALRLLRTRPLARQELESVLHAILSDVRPIYPSLPDLAASPPNPAE